MFTERKWDKWVNSILACTNDTTINTKHVARKKFWNLQRLQSKPNARRVLKDFLCFPEENLQREEIFLDAKCFLHDIPVGRFHILVSFGRCCPVGGRGDPTVPREFSHIPNDRSGKIYWFNNGKCKLCHEPIWNTSCFICLSDKTSVHSILFVWYSFLQFLNMQKLIHTWWCHTSIFCLLTYCWKNMRALMFTFQSLLFFVFWSFLMSWWFILELKLDF